MTPSALLPKILLSVLKGQPKALRDSHYPAWHLAPATGLLNDPNGFIHGTHSAVSTITNAGGTGVQRIYYTGSMSR